MGSRIRKKISKKGGISAQKRMNTKVSSQLESKFAKMHITPSQSVPDIAQVKKNHDIRHAFYKELGVEPQLPDLLYESVQKVIEAVQQLEKNGKDRVAQVKLAGAEQKIKRLVEYYDDDLPRGWKYDRANALALLV